MSNIPDAPETAATSNRSLRIRQTRVDYSEDGGDEDRSKAAQSKEKKRGSKRKAELNIESLYCQENVKDISPTSLETIFESPQKGENRGRIRGSKVAKNVSEMSTEAQVMSVRKWKRFCSFSNFYHPSKQKTKVRKDRAKKLKQLTGVKLPKGIVSDEALQTVLAVLSENEDQNENIHNGASYKSTTSFYIGNVIRPDVEDASMNDVIRTISTMQMVNEQCDERDLLPQDLMRDFDDPLLFSDEKDHPRPLPSKEKKSRRRSEKFSGCLLPSSSRRTSGRILCPLPLTNEVEELTKLNSSAGDIPKRLEDKKLEYLDSNNEEQMIREVMVDVKNAPKRRNVLNDKKVVKKPKRLEPTLKRQNESKDEQCLKKRGNLKDKEEKTHIIGHYKDDDVQPDIRNRSATLLQHSFENLSDMPIKLSEYQNPGAQRSVDSGSVQLNPKTSGPMKGKRRGKRRVSGVQRPLYRTILEPSSPEEFLNVSPSYSPNLGDKKSCASHCLNTSSDSLHETNHKYTSANCTSPVSLSSVKQDVPKVCPSPTSPCTQMAALTLQTDQESASRNLSVNNLKTVKPQKRTRRKSKQLSIGSVFKAVPSNIPKSDTASLPLELSAVCSNKVESTGIESCCEKSDVVEGLQDFSEIPNEKCEISRQVQKKRGRQLMTMFSQLELRNDGKEEIKYPLVTEDIGEVDSLCTNKREFTVNSKDSNSNAENFGGPHDIQTKDIAFSDNKDTNQVHSSKKNCAVEHSVPPLMCAVKSEKNTDDKCDTRQEVINQDNCICDSQDNVKHVSKSSQSNIDQNCPILEEGIEWNSPIITGMFKNKAVVRCGKVYRNKDSTAESPIILTYLHNPQYNQDCPPKSKSNAPSGSGNI